MKEEIARVLKIVGLEGVKKRVGRFSMGMKQRLGIANAILGNPEILILDEPANGLDPQGIADVRNMIKRLNEEFGMTVIVSSHMSRYMNALLLLMIGGLEYHEDDVQNVFTIQS